jgi:hypothetical protein
VQKSATSLVTATAHHAVVFLDLTSETSIPEQTVPEQAARSSVPPGEPVATCRAPAFAGPRAPRGTPESWLAATRAIDRPVTRARQAAQLGAPYRHQVAGRAGFLALLQAGYRLTRWARVTLVSPRDAEPLDVRMLELVAGDLAEARGLAPGRELEGAEAALRPSTFRDLLEIEPVLAAPRHELPARRRHRESTVVHLCGHGAAQGVMLGDGGAAEPLAGPQALPAMLREAGRPARILVLDACYGADQVRSILAHADCCLGRLGSVGETAASLREGGPRRAR